MAEQKYVMVELGDWEAIRAKIDESTQVLLERVYGHLTGDSFIDENDHWEIDPKQALEAAMELRDRLHVIECAMDRSTDYTGKPYSELVYTETERNLLHKVLNEMEDWD